MKILELDERRAVLSGKAQFFFDQKHIFRGSLRESELHSVYFRWLFLFPVGLDEF